MLSEIGSSFWINPKDNNFSFNEISPRLFGIPFSDFAWLSTGRSAIALAIECAESNNKHFSRRVLLPSYTCESVIKPFLDKGYSVEFFSLNERLEPDLSEIKKSIINRTGLKQLTAVLKELQEIKTEFSSLELRESQDGTGVIVLAPRKGEENGQYSLAAPGEAGSVSGTDGI